MTWTRNKPTVAGWYWWRYAGEPAVVRVIHSMYGLVIEGHVGLVQNMNAHWLGPLTPDSYQQGRVAGLVKAVEIIKANTDVKKAIEIIRLHSLAQQAQKEKGMARKARKVYRLDQVVDMIREACAQEGSQYSQTWLLYQWATKHKLSPQYVTDLLKGRRSPGPAVLKIFRLEAVTQYREVQ